MQTFQIQENQSDKNSNTQNLQTPTPSPNTQIPKDQFSYDNVIDQLKEENSDEENQEQSQLKTKQQGKGVSTEPFTQIEAKYERNVEDFTVGFQDNRNILHRAALEQNKQLIADVLNEYITVLQGKKMSQKEINQEVQSFINMKDKFHLTALILCCIMNVQIDNASQQENDQRFECIKELHKNGAQLDAQNSRTLWRSINWCAFYGDFKSCQYLLANGSLAFLPDYKGRYPFDLAGEKEHKGVVELLVKTLISQIIKYEKFLVNKLPSHNVDEFIFYQEIQNNYKKFIENPLLRVKLLYWQCYFGLDYDLIQSTIRFSRVYYNAPIYSLGLQTPLHAAAQAKIFVETKGVLQSSPREVFQDKSQDNSMRIIDLLIETQCLKKNLKKFVHDYEHLLENRVRLKYNEVFPFSKEEQLIYKDEFKKEVKNFAIWEKKYIRIIQDYLKSGGQNQSYYLQNDKNLIDVLNMETGHRQSKLLNLNESDIYGNTALHLASIKGNYKIVHQLLQYEADMEIENKEFFKPRQLTQDQKVIEVYQSKLEQDNQESAISETNNCVNEQIDQILNERKKLKEEQKNNVLTKVGFRSATYSISSDEISILDHERLVREQEQSQAIKQMVLYQNQLFVPDFVLKYKILETEDKNETLFDLVQSNNSDTPELQRLNFQISMLQKANFEIYLMKSYFEKGCYYIMLRHKEENLEEQAQKLKLQVKLMDSYDLEPFEVEIQDLFEPFRSRQRQEIIEGHVKRIMNLDQLIKAEVLQTFYRMHTSGGITKINEKWIENQKWYWPQPFNQFKDYFYEGKNQNFESLTTLRLYLGEKISFYFAWKSYFTCSLLILAVPGAIFQLYILLTNQYNSRFLPYWVFFVCIWATFQVEFWKRKTAEIVTRWGCLDLLEDEQAENSTIREGFSGYEEIYEVTGEVTKHQKKSLTRKILLISIPILAFFVTLSIGCFVLVEYLVENYSYDNTIIKLALGIGQGLGITILNQIYTYVAYYFALRENHKYQAEYEKSLIYKNAFFKFINSYISIFYFIFKHDKTLENIFNLMLPVLIVKQVNYMLLDVSLPSFLYQRKEDQYFEKIKQTIKFQYKSQRKQNTFLGEGSRYAWIDAIGAFWKARVKKPLFSSQRAVLKIENEETIKFNLIQDNQLKLETFLDADAVELNSLKLDFNSTLNYFMESMIDYGYIILFAAAFPIGPVIAMIVSVPELRMKIYTFIYVYKRSKCERSGGMGEWLNILEGLSLVSVFTNFALLYFKQSTAAAEVYYQTELVNENSSYSLWFTILSIVILLVLKYAVQYIIPDRPSWVTKEIEKMSAKKKQESSKNIGQQIRDIKNSIEEYQKKYRSLKRQIKRNTEEMKEMEMKKKTTSKKLEIEFNRLQAYNQQLLGISQDKKQQNMTNLFGKRSFITEYDMIILGILRKKYSQIEGQLQISRLYQIHKLVGQLICLCQDCDKVSGQLECVECNVSYCLKCYKEAHLTHDFGNHQVFLLNEISNYSEEDLDQLNVVIRAKQNIKQKFKIGKEVKEQFQNDLGLKMFKKLEYFSIPTYKKSEHFKYLKEAFDILFSEYISAPGIELRDYQIDIKRVLLVKNGTTPQISLPVNKKSRNSLIQPVRTFQVFLNDPNFNIEDKLFINRLAFLTFKRMRHTSNFKQFYTFCQQLQDGLLEQRVILFADIVDISDDNFITKQELERQIITSFIQDITMAKNSLFLVDQIFQGVYKKTKREVIQILLDGCQIAIIRDFLVALLQERNITINF